MLLQVLPDSCRTSATAPTTYVEQAILTGSSLVPILVFGEHQLLRPCNQSRMLQVVHQWLGGMFQCAVPVVHGRGIFNWDLGFFPPRSPVRVVVGRPIDPPCIEHQGLEYLQQNAQGRKLVARCQAKYEEELSNMRSEYIHNNSSIRF